MARIRNFGQRRTRHTRRGGRHEYGEDDRLRSRRLAGRTDRLVAYGLRQQYWANRIGNGPLYLLARASLVPEDTRLLWIVYAPLVNRILEAGR